MKNFVPEFGKIKEKKQLSDNKTVEVEHVYQNRISIGRKLRYEERYRVHSMADARAKVEELASRIEKDGSMVEPAIRYDGKVRMAYKGKFDVVFEYTRFLPPERTLSPTIKK